MPIRNSYRNAVLDARPLGYWRLDESAGVVAADATTHGRAGTIAGAPSFNADGWPADGNTAITLSGGQDVRVAGSGIGATGRQPFSLLAAVMPTAGGMGTVRTILHDGAGFLGVTAADLVQFGQFGATLVSAGAAVVAGSYIWVLGTYDGHALRLYVDGSLAAGPTAWAFTSGRGTLYAGRRGGSVDGWVGRLDEVAWWDRVVGAAEAADLYASRTILGNQQALMYARSGIARSGATRSDYYNEVLSLTIAGTSQAHKVWKGTTRIRKAMNEQPDSAGFRTFDIAPTPGQEVVIGSGAINNRQFGGVILRSKKVAVKSAGGTPTRSIHDVECGDWTFVLARRRVLKRFTSQPAHLIFLALAAEFAPEFTTANVVSSSPVIDEIQFGIETTLPQAFTRLGNLCDPVHRWYPDASKGLHFFERETSQSPRDITPANLMYEGLEYDAFIGQIRTRILARGGGAQSTSIATVGATSVAVDDCSWYEAGGGTVIEGQQKLTYTGRSAASGPGSLTGIPATGVGSILYTIPVGSKLQVFVQVDDAAAQTALATLSSAFGDGVYEYPITDGNRSLAGITELAYAELSKFSTILESGGYVTRDKFADVGKDVRIALPGRDISLTAPILEAELRWVAHQRMERRVRFDSAVKIDLRDVVRAMQEAQA